MWSGLTQWFTFISLKHTIYITYSQSKDKQDVIMCSEALFVFMSNHSNSIITTIFRTGMF